MLPISPRSSNQMPKNANGAYESPLLIFTCKRPEYLTRTLQNVLNTISQPCAFGCPVIVSEDGQHNDIQEVVSLFKKKFEGKGVGLVHIRHPRGNRLKGNAYEALAKHYGWALSQVFDGVATQKTQHQVLPQRVIILEEDIQVAPDFFSYMESMSSILDNDPTIYTVSSFNDNGHLEGGDPKRLLRSDFFPGLGWMMNRDLWKNELESKWPPGYWDDWLRDKAQRKDRQILRPEVSRTYHFGSQGGASANQFGRMLERNKLNKQAVQWDMEDLSYLENSVYEKQYTDMVMNSKLVHSVQEAKQVSPGLNVRMEYNDFSRFSILAEQLGIMKDEKDMVPRTAYRGIVEVRLSSTSLLFLMQKGGFGGYKKK